MDSVCQEAGTREPSQVCCSEIMSSTSANLQKEVAVRPATTEVQNQVGPSSSGTRSDPKPVQDERTATTAPKPGQTSNTVQTKKLPVQSKNIWFNLLIILQCLVLPSKFVLFPTTRCHCSPCKMQIRRIQCPLGQF